MRARVYTRSGLKRRHAQADEEPLGVLADGTGGGGQGGVDDLSAVEAHPLDACLRPEESVVFHQIGKAAEAVPVRFFHGGDHLKGLANLGEALLHGNLGKTGIVVLPLLVFVVLGGAQVLQGCGIEVDGIGAVNGDVLSREGLKVVIKDFGVGPLLVGGEEKDLLDDL